MMKQLFLVVTGFSGATAVHHYVTATCIETVVVYFSADARKSAHGPVRQIRILDYVTEL